MAKLKSIAPSAVLDTPPAMPLAEFKSISKHPAELPALLTQAHHEGWTLLTIVPCHWNDEHVAYLKRLL